MRLPIVSLFLLLCLVASIGSDAQNTAAKAPQTDKLYHPADDAATEIAKAVATAKKEKKHVLLQAGGNWCVWCYRFNAFVQTDSTLKNLLDRNFVVYHLNYSKENMNPEVFRQLGYPQRFGFPSLIVLDGEGNRIHTQDSGLLEKGNGYDFDKVKTFLVNWAPSALDPAYYKEQDQ